MPILGKESNSSIFQESAKKVLSKVFTSIFRISLDMAWMEA